MASIYSRGKILYLGWYEETLAGERIHRSETLKLKDTRENRKLAKLYKKKKENMLLFSNNKVQRAITISQAYQKFIETKREKAAATRVYYNSALRLLLKNYGKENVGKISSDHIKGIEKGTI